MSTSKASTTTEDTDRSPVRTELLSVRSALRAELFGRVRVSQALLVAVTLVAWEITGRVVGSYYLPTPSQVWGAGVEALRSGLLLQAIRQSLSTLFIGYGLAIAVGIPLGFVMGWYRWIGRVLDPFVNGLYVVPMTALVPLVIVWFGLGVRARVVSIFLFAVFQILVSTYAGVRTKDEVLVEVARSFGARSLPLLRKVVFFDALPHIFTGLRLGASQAIKGMVVAEFLFAATGLGGQIVEAANRYETPRMFVYIFVTIVLGILLAGAMQMIERALVRGR